MFGIGYDPLGSSILLGKYGSKIQLTGVSLQNESFALIGAG